MAKFIGSELVDYEVVSRSLSDDGTTSCTQKIVGKCAQRYFNKALKCYVDPTLRGLGTPYIVGASWNSPAGSGVYDTVEITKSTKWSSQNPELNCGNGVLHNVSASVSLQQVALIEHPKYRWIAICANRCVSRVYDSETSIETTLMKAVQQYVSMQQSPDCAGTSYFYALKEMLSEEEPPDDYRCSLSALNYANKIIAGVQGYLTPQITVTIEHAVRNRGELDDGTDTVGKLVCLPSPFTSWNSNWSSMYSGREVSYDYVNKSGSIRDTYISLPICGGWDTEIYYKK